MEVKSRLDLAAIEQMKGKMDRLFHWMPEHRGKEFQGMVAYVDGSAAARHAVLEQGWHLVHVGAEFDVRDSGNEKKGHRNEKNSLLPSLSWMRK